MQLLRMGPTDDWGDAAKEQIRILADEACCHSSVNRSTLIRNLKTELSVATVKAMPLCFRHASAS